MIGFTNVIKYYKNMYNPYFFLWGGLSDERIRRYSSENEIGIIIERFPILLLK